MVSTTPSPEDSAVILSSGASLALSSVFHRVIGKSSKGSKAASKHVIFCENADVQATISSARVEKKRVREARLAKLKFESNGRVVPDASTDATLEKQLVVTATKGAVALFNAVAKARKMAKMEEKVEKEGTKKRKKDALTKDSFLKMIRKGVRKEEESEDEGEREQEDEGGVRKKARWLKDDYMTRGSTKLKDWDKPTDVLQSDDSESEEEEREEEEESGEMEIEEEEESEDE